MRHDKEGGCGPKWGWARRGKGGPWGGGPPWARFGGPFGPGGGRPGRMFGQGDLPLLLLALIADKPSHGYDLIRTIEAKFGGSYAPSPGTIYPTLTLLEEQDLILGETEGGAKKSYAATDKGRAHLEENAEQVKALMTRIDIMAGATSAGPIPDSVTRAVHTLRHAIVAKTWNAAEEERVREVLEKAAREIVAGKSGNS
jgi:DNA-binding PadR family transcriptional regulator